MCARQIARASRLAIDTSLERLRHRALRQRLAQPQREHAATHSRALHDDHVWVLRVGLTGTEALFPVGAAGIQRARATAPAGRPFRARDLERRAGGDRRLVVDAIGCRIAPLLPQAYRGVYDEAAPELDEPHRLAARYDRRAS